MLIEMPNNIRPDRKFFVFFALDEAALEPLSGLKYMENTTILNQEAYSTSSV